MSKKKRNSKKRVSTDEILPFDSLASNRPSSENIYLDRSEGKSRLDVADDPRKSFNNPWESGPTMGDQRKETYGDSQDRDLADRSGRTTTPTFGTRGVINRLRRKKKK